MSRGYGPFAFGFLSGAILFFWIGLLFGEFLK